jgi:hypothetical protein
MINKLKTAMLAIIAIVMVGVTPTSSASVMIFDVSGTLHNDSLLSGTISIDTALGVVNPVTALSLHFSGGRGGFNGVGKGVFNAFTENTLLTAHTLSGFSGPNGYFEIEAGSFTGPYIKLMLHTGSLVGYTGGVICGDANPVLSTDCGFSSTVSLASGVYAAFVSGNVTPRAGHTSVPEPAAWTMMLIGVGIMRSSIAYRRRLTKARSDGKAVRVV